MATESGVAPSAVRFHERYGVITAARTASNQRRFDDSAACRIKVAKLAQRVGLTVREIAEVFAELPADPQPADRGPRRPDPHRRKPKPEPPTCAPSSR